MYFQQQVYTTAATEPSLNLDPSVVPFNTTVAVTLLTGPASYKMQWSLDPFGTVTDANAKWFDSVDIPANTAASATSVMSFPVARVRLVIATLTAGSLTFQVQQGTSVN